MTDQYLPTNVNAPRGSRLITEDAFLTLDDDLVVVENTSAESIALVLPDATQIPAREIKFKANTLTSSVVIGTVGGQTIDGAPTASLTADQETVCLKSDGANWRKVCGSVDCCAPVLLQLPADFQDDLINAQGGFVVYNFQATKVEVDGNGEPLATVVLLDEFNSPNTPIVTVQFFGVVGTADGTQEITIAVQETGVGDSGFLWVLLQNPCGCCVLVGSLLVSIE